MSSNGDTKQADPLGAAEALGPEARLFVSHADPLGFMSALGEVGKGLVANPSGARIGLFSPRRERGVVRCASSTGLTEVIALPEAPW